MDNIKFTFETIDQFVQFSDNSKHTICSCILTSLTNAFQESEINPILFEVAVEDSDNTFELSLDRSQWETALEKCLEILVDKNQSDEAIDTYLLLKNIKQVEVLT